MVPSDQVQAFVGEMQQAGVAYQLVGYPGAKHAFPIPRPMNWGSVSRMPLAYNKAATPGPGRRRSSSSSRFLPADRISASVRWPFRRAGLTAADQLAASARILSWCLPRSTRTRAAIAREIGSIDEGGERLRLGETEPCRRAQPPPVGEGIELIPNELNLAHEDVGADIADALEFLEETPFFLRVAAGGLAQLPQITLVAIEQHTGCLAQHPRRARRSGRSRTG